MARFLNLSSSIHRYRVWAALLAVVVNGIRKVGISDRAVDSLLADQSKSVALSRIGMEVLRFSDEGPFAEEALELVNRAEGREWLALLHSETGRMIEDQLRAALTDQ